MEDEKSKTHIRNKNKLEKFKNTIINQQFGLSADLREGYKTKITSSPHNYLITAIAEEALIGKKNINEADINPLIKQMFTKHSTSIKHQFRFKMSF